ncbi:MAG TPA: ABC transporter permease [Kofleriaceae bacterium]|jgi:ABC-2 type transport system permease protein|nr:ABC transporter permease [Kofleriaceae bacterium]
MPRGLRDALVIARREFVERVRSRWFVAITLLGPLGMIALVLVPALLIGRGVEGSRIDIVDRSGVLAQPLSDELTREGWKPTIVPRDTAKADEMARIRDQKINGFITIPDSWLDSGPAGQIVYLGDNASNEGVDRTLRVAVQRVVQRERGLRAHIDPGTLETVLQKANFAPPQHTNGKTEEASGLASFVIAYFLAFILYMVITLYGVNVMRSVVQEKTTRVMELMVATVKPRSLMTGKILGVGGAGLVQIVAWLAMGAVTLGYREQLLGWFGVSGGGSALPPLELGAFVVVIAYFVLGYFFYATMYAAVGAMVSSEQDTQQVQMPITMLLVIGALCLQMVSNAPRGSATVIMTMIPFWSPMLMPMRYVLGGASPLDVVISLAILTASIVLIARAAAKIYRIGVLMYGKRPTAQELLRWLRY